MVTLPAISEIDAIFVFLMESPHFDFKFGFWFGLLIKLIRLFSPVLISSYNSFLTFCKFLFRSELDPYATPFRSGAASLN
jgi:hypothetical protein